ncbi:syntaxin-related protein KNOLLE-like [Dendrobium catenatum]|uniref:Syntaxin-112 n=1 Tax=Dendrobium catenatum TaxID=906689 RepID=A0A2I0VYQ7_9ASPA|nr:syntaxin-related protein KNOLLE-like [Dendrobium catenatum]PKU68519.1 Syntaxin-112 [Dendrobium catenatum]
MKNLVTRSFLSYADLNKEAMKDIEAGGGDENQDERQMTDESLRVFYQEVELLEEEMASIRKLLAFLKATNKDSMSADRHILKVVKISLGIRGRIDDVKRSNAANGRLPCCSEGTSVNCARPGGIFRGGVGEDVFRREERGDPKDSHLFKWAEQGY